MSSTDKPWYRQFWLLFVLAPLVVVVIASFATLIIAGAPPALVVDDFGAVALAIEQDRARDLRAAELGLRAEIRFLESGGTHRVQARLEGATPPTLHLQLVHPTRDSLDRRATLESAGGEYGAVFARLRLACTWSSRIPPANGD
jgi:hypothetical protein